MGPTVTEFSQDKLLSRSFLGLKAAVALYVLAIPIAHVGLPQDWVWGVALFFLLAMLGTYPLAALKQRSFLTTETVISTGLAAAGIAGFWLSPVLIIGAIFGHGVWDLFKHNGFGTPFFRWYLTGCVIVDWIYAAALSVFLITS